MRYCGSHHLRPPGQLCRERHGPDHVKQRSGGRIVTLFTSPMQPTGISWPVSSRPSTPHPQRPLRSPSRGRGMQESVVTRPRAPRESNTTPKWILGERAREVDKVEGPYRQGFLRPPQPPRPSPLWEGRGQPVGSVLYPEKQYGSER